MADPEAPHVMLPAVVRAFIQRHRIPSDAVRDDQRVVLTLDERYRVHVVGGPHQAVVLWSELMPWPEGADRRADELLQRLARMAAGLFRTQAATLCIDRRRPALVLQQTLRPGADVATLEDALAELANALAFWSPLCRSEAAAWRGVGA